MALMAVWEILEIEPTSDTKVIKRAYAAKLKVTRPDEDPKGFQELHWAYKTALQQAEWIARREAAAEDDPDYDYEDEDYDEYQYQHTIVDSTPPPTIDHPISVATIDEQQFQTVIQPPDYAQQEANQLIEKVKLVLASGHQADKNSWSFIVESSYILDDVFTWNLGLEILKLIREHNLKNLSKIPEMVGQDVLTYLDSIFNWKSNQYQIYQVLGKDYESWIELILDSPRHISWQDKIRGGKKLSEKKEKKKTPEAQPKSGNTSGCMIFILIFLLIKFIIVISDNLAPSKPNHLQKNPDHHRHLQLINNDPLGVSSKKTEEAASSEATKQQTSAEPKCKYSKHATPNLSSLCRPIDLEKLPQ